MLICQQTHKSHRNYHIIAVRLLFIHKTIGLCIKQDQERAQGIQLPVSHTLSDHLSAMVSGHLGPCQEWKFFFIMNELHVDGWNY